MSTRGAQFDDWQFQGRYQNHAVSVKSKITFDDYGRSMSTAYRAEGRGWVPPFALNNEQLQRVLLQGLGVIFIMLCRCRKMWSGRRLLVPRPKKLCNPIT
jgi:hypothetical protein